jgi:hypothetical protein
LSKLSLKKEKGRNKKEGAKPPLKTTSPFPLSRGRGIKKGDKEGG